MHERRSGCQRLLGVDHVRQRFVLDLDQFGGVLGERARVGDHRRDPFAGVAHDVVRQRVARHLRAHRRRSRSESVRGAEFLAGQHVVHARHRERRVGVDREDARAGVRRGDQRHVLHPGSAMSATKRPRPVTKRGSSLVRRLRADVAEPMAAWQCAHLASLGQALGGERDRIDDLLVAGAAAQVAADRLADLLLGRPRVGVEQRLRRDQHARRAVAALQRVRLAEAVLQHAQRAVGLRQALDRGDAVAVRLHREHQAGAHRLAVEHDRARAADAVLAADVRAGEAQILAQPVDEREPRRHLAVRLTPLTSTEIG